MSDFYFKVPFAEGGQTNTIPLDEQPSGAVSFTEGWGPDYSLNLATDPAAKPVARLTQNTLFNLITNALKQYQEIGTYDFITPDLNSGDPFPYEQNAEAWFDDGDGPYKYRSLVTGNVADPTDATVWQRENFYVAGVATGTANAITLNTAVDYFGGGDPPPEGARISFKAIANNTGPATFKLGTSAPISIKKISPGGIVDTDLGDITTDGIYLLVVSGGIYLLLDPTGITASDLTDYAKLDAINNFTKYQNIPVYYARVTFGATGTQTITGNTSDPIEFDTIPPNGDEFGLWDAINFEFVIPQDGMYEFTSSCLGHIASTSAQHLMALYLYVNGSKTVNLNGSFLNAGNPDGATVILSGSSGSIPLSAGDTVRVVWFNQFASSVTLGYYATTSDAGTQSFFECKYLGPSVATPGPLLKKLPSKKGKK